MWSVIVCTHGRTGRSMPVVCIGKHLTPRNNVPPMPRIEIDRNAVAHNGTLNLIGKMACSGFLSFGMWPNNDERKTGIFIFLFRSFSYRIFLVWYDGRGVVRVHLVHILKCWMRRLATQLASSNMHVRWEIKALTGIVWRWRDAFYLPFSLSLFLRLGLFFSIVDVVLKRITRYKAERGEKEREAKSAGEENKHRT